MANNKTIGKWVLLVTMFVLFIGAAQAAAVLVRPATSESITGATYNVSLTSTLTPLVNCSVVATSTATGDTATIMAYNYTGSGTALNATFDTTDLEDGADYSFAATCYNTTSQTETITTTSVTVDNTVPTAPSAITPTTASDKANVAISSTVVAATTTGCTAVLASSYSTETVTMTHSGATCTYTYSFPGSGIWAITITASDGTNSTAASASSLKISEQGGVAVGAASTAARSTKVDDNKKIFFVLLLGVGAVVGYQKGWFGKGGSSPRKRKRSSKKRKGRY